MAKKIIVIGAGIAGLSAAQNLAVKNEEVLILEARQRLGGRIYTITASDNHTPVELGASYWEGDNVNPFYQRYFSENDPLKPFAKMCMDPLTIIDLSTPVRETLSNEKISMYFNLANIQLKNAITSRNGKTCEQMINDCDLTQLPSNAAYWVKKCMELLMSHQSTPLSNIGFPTFDIPSDPEGIYACHRDANFCFVGNGYDKVVSQLAKECIDANVKIISNTPVKKIYDKAEKGVEIQTSNGCFEADVVVCTIPLGVLKHQAKTLFIPALSNEKLQAIETMGVHESTRVVLEFDAPFWDIDAPYLLLCSPEKSGMKEFRNNYPLHGKAILQTPNYAAESKNITDFDLIDLIMSDLRNAFYQKELSSLKQFYVYRWSDDPFAQGAYPYRTINMNETMHQALERSEGNIYFAGADFSRHGFSVHHAYASGKQIAKEINQLFERSVHQSI